MKKQVFGRRLKRDTNERKALFKSLMSSFVLKERIKTTEAKAKAIKGRVEKLVTEAKKTLRGAQGKKGKQAANLFYAYLSKDAIDKLIADVAPRFTERKGGYTRILRLGPRFSDNAQMVLMEWVEGPRLQEESITSIKSLPAGEAGTTGKRERKVSKTRSTQVKRKSTTAKREKIK